jgi:hypothetical protein
LVLVWCFNGVKHLSTCHLSSLWLLAEPSDQNFGRPSLNFWNCFLCKTHTRLAKNNFPVKFCVF